MCTKQIIFDSSAFHAIHILELIVQQLPFDKSTEFILDVRTVKLDIAFLADIIVSKHI